MPIFEYRCLDCGQTHEFLKRAGEEAKCPYCGSTRLTKLMSRFNSNVSGSKASSTCSTCSSGLCSTCGK
ncbi:MAG TPA: zinc ribbon domain-containing protein [Firmicutes bacterium]|nr:zinc ribbon domain-containing protein [Candidatus Fermentithermobacillaceae bacterium]